MIKKAIIVIGVSYQLMCKNAQMLFDSHDSSSFYIDEKEYICKYVENNNYHKLCQDVWLEPIKNKIVIELLNKTEEIFNDQLINCVVISSQFCLNKEVKEIYVSILKDQGYEVEIVPITSTWLNIIKDAIDFNIPLKEVINYWNQFNAQFSRTYEPDTYMPKAILVDTKILLQDSNGYQELTLMIKSLSKNGYKILFFVRKEKQEKIEELIKSLCFDDKEIFLISNSKYESIEKKEIFWSKLVYHYNVTLIFEINADCVFYWRKISAPVISLCNEFALEKINDSY